MFEHGCAKCEKTFVSRSKLNHHNNQLHEDRECDECGKIFKKRNFARHLKVHSDTGFTCQICAKTFNRKDKLQEHVKRLHEEELYKCDICEKTFADERYLKIHMDTYQAHRLLTSGLKAHKVVHASLGSRFGQQDLYFPPFIEILMIYFFPIWIHTAPDWCQPDKFATLSFSAFLVVCDRDKKPHVGQQIL